jgi:hypothetical protein
MKSFSSEQLQSLNAKSTTGRFIEAVIFTRDQDTGVKDYFVRNGREISFKGNIYTPLDFAWEGMKVTSAMELPSNRVVVSNLGGQVINYLEDESVSIEGNDVVLQVLFIDKFNKITLVDEMLFQVEVIVADYHEAATFNLGVNYSLNDIIPRGTIETLEFPGIRDDVIRVGT